MSAKHKAEKSALAHSIRIRCRTPIVEFVERPARPAYWRSNPGQALGQRKGTLSIKDANLLVDPLVTGLQ
jgi:hypothetical protein